MAITFAVSDVEVANAPMTVLDREVAIRSLLGSPPASVHARYAHERAAAPDNGGVLFDYSEPAPPSRKIEAISTSDRPLVYADEAHALARAAHEAFFLHYPLTLSPDVIWFCLAQGFAHHVALNAERLRERFVRHQGKVKLVVERPDFVLGQANPWPEVFAAFSEQIASHVGRLRDLVVADFSTTGAVERAAFEVVLMDTFQGYFEYEGRIGCGIPSITLLGTVDDWKNVRRRAAVLGEYGLEGWIRSLMPILDIFVRTAEGHVDAGFWRSFFRYESASGAAELTGWIHVLFPYLKIWEQGDYRLAPNPHLSGWETTLRAAEARTDWREMPRGPGLWAIPGSIASAPVKLIDVRDGSEHELRFVAGLFGVTQDATNHALSPEFGWGVVHETPQS